MIAKMKVSAAASTYSGRPTPHWKTQPGSKPSLTYVCAKCSKRGDHLVEDCTSEIKASLGAGLPASTKIQITEEQAKKGVIITCVRAADDVGALCDCVPTSKSYLCTVTLATQFQQCVVRFMFRIFRHYAGLITGATHYAPTAYPAAVYPRCSGRVSLDTLLCLYHADAAWCWCNLDR